MNNIIKLIRMIKDFFILNLYYLYKSFFISSLVSDSLKEYSLIKMEAQFILF